MAAVTLQTLKADVLARAQIDSDDPAAVLLVRNINEGIKFVRSTLLKNRQAGLLISSTPALFTTVRGEQTVDLPVDFEGLAGVEVQISGEWRVMEEFDFADRHAQGQDAAWFVRDDGKLSAKWCLLDDVLFFQDPPDGIYSGRIWYVPQLTNLAVNADQVNLLNHDDIVVCFAAASCLDDNQLGADHLWARVSGWEKRIEKMAKRRRRGSYKVTRDVTGATANLTTRIRDGVP